MSLGAQQRIPPRRQPIHVVVGVVRRTAARIGDAQQVAVGVIREVCLAADGISQKSRVRLLRHNNFKRKSGYKNLTPIFAAHLVYLALAEIEPLR